MSAMKDLTGKEFGYLTPISYIKENGKVKWKCKCRCGKEVTVAAGNLCNGHTKSCGCIMRENLVGKKFGELEVIELDEEKTKNGKTYWKCLCSCGNTVSALASKLKSGRRTNCSGYAHDKVVGKKFGRLTVCSKFISENGKRKFLCKCDCGNEVYVLTKHLISGHTQSCGCKIDKNFIGNISRTHGMSETRIYGIWLKMRNRIHMKNIKEYKNYGGRGIKICKEWDESFENFCAWAMLNGYRYDLSIDRIDVNGNYEPSNCRWTTAKVQANNTRTNIYIEYNGERKTLAQWAEKYNIPYKTFYYRYVIANWSIDDCIKTPIGEKRKNKKAVEK